MSFVHEDPPVRWNSESAAEPGRFAPDASGQKMST